MSGEQAHHGFNDDAATRRLLRSPPSPAALAWAETAAGEKIATWSVLRGGMSSAMYLIELDDPSFSRLVLRCYVRPEVNQEEPDLAAREAAALAVAAGVEVATPSLVAVDPRGESVGVPAVLMTWLPGRVVWDARGVQRWLAGLAAVLPAIHAGDSSHVGLGRYANYEQESYATPKWATKPRVWERAVEVFHGPVLDRQCCFIHRDFHPGNVLWRRSLVTGVVDWQSACVGPPSVDIGHCRANLLRYSRDLANQFRHVAEETTGRPFHPWADVAALIGMLDGLRTSPPGAAGRHAIEAALEQALALLQAG